MELEQKKKTISVVTSSRAEFGLLSGVIDELTRQGAELQLLVTGSHLSKNFGETITEIEAFGYHITECFDILLESKEPRTDVVFSRAVSLFGGYFSNNRPDMVVLLGDRYEILAVALTASFFNIPIAHISGGDVTTGALDDAFRHCITKLALLHFTSTEVARKRVIQLGESSERVFNVGALGTENILKISVLSKEELTSGVGFDFNVPYLLATYHPETMSENSIVSDITAFLSALDAFGLPVLFTKANADTGGGLINEMVKDYCTKHSDSMLVDSLGMVKYINAMRYASALVGNSSSAIVESPSFKIPSVSIGDRQKGREMASNIISCARDSVSILEALKKALSSEFRDSTRNMVNPYEGKDVAKNIVAYILRFLNKPFDIAKEFYDVSFEEKL